MIRFILVFLTLSCLSLVANEIFSIDFGQSNYWNHHGIFLLVFLTFFPRITLLLSSLATGGLVWWLGWIFFPRFLVAMLATSAYWNHNKVLVTLAWLVALGGESTEKTIVFRKGPKNWGQRYPEAIPTQGRRLDDP